MLPYLIILPLLILGCATVYKQERSIGRDPKAILTDIVLAIVLGVVLAAILVWSLSR